MAQKTALPGGATNLDTARIDKVVLSLLGLALDPATGTAPNEFPAAALNRLFERGLLVSGAPNNGVISLTARGQAVAREFVTKHFQNVASSSFSSAPTAPLKQENHSAQNDLPESLREVLAEHHAGPTTGVFTDGGARPNPGPGGWGFVVVENNTILAQRCGRAEDTTNNRMELTALIEAYKLLPLDSKTTIFSDSNLCVQTINEWAHAWKQRGWKKKDGQIKNLDLVKELYALAEAHPQVKLEWIKAHNGWRWNEYVDVLASAWTRDEEIPEIG